MLGIVLSWYVSHGVENCWCVRALDCDSLQCSDSLWCCCDMLGMVLRTVGVSVGLSQY